MSGTHRLAALLTLTVASAAGDALADLVPDAPVEYTNSTLVGAASTTSIGVPAGWRGARVRLAGRRARDGMGRRSGLKIRSRKAWGFESPRAHHVGSARPALALSHMLERFQHHVGGSNTAIHRLARLRAGS
jgi:hypothetical protein